MTKIETPSSVLNRLLDPIIQCLTPETARKLVDLRADAVVQGRVDELADKSTAGLLSPDETAEYATYVTASSLIGILQSKARKILAAPFDHINANVDTQREDC